MKTAMSNQQWRYLPQRLEYISSTAEDTLHPSPSILSCENPFSISDSFNMILTMVPIFKTKAEMSSLWGFLRFFYFRFLGNYWNRQLLSVINQTTNPQLGNHQTCIVQTRSFSCKNYMLNPGFEAVMSHRLLSRSPALFSGLGEQRWSIQIS